MLILAFPYLWNEKSREFQRGDKKYVFPRRYDVLFAPSRDSLDQSGDALYRIIIMRYNKTYHKHDKLRLKE